MRRLTLLVLAAAVAGVAPAPASAAPWRCEAAAMTGSLLGGTVALPAVRANPGAAGCVSQTVGGTATKPPFPLDSAALVAQTAISGAASDPAAQKVLAVGGVADLRVRSLPGLPVTLPEIPIPASLAAVSVPVPAVPLLLPAQTITLDLRQAVQALVPTRLLPDLDIVRVQGAVAYAAAQCVGSAPKLAGASQVAGVTVLGQSLPLDQVIDQAATLLSSGTIDLSNVDLSKVTLPAGLSLDLPVVGPVLRTAIQGVLDGLPDIAIPATIAQVKVTPGEQTTTGGLLTQRALHVQVSLLGLQLADTTLGEASVGAGDVDCAVPAATPTDLALQCTKKDLVLVDVYEHKGRVELLGAADRKYAGKTVSIVFEATGDVVAHAKVAASGAFETTAALPPRAMRDDNDARYQAVLGKERSMNLKLERRMVVDEMLSRSGKVLISGRVVGPLSRPVEAITVTRRVSCTKSEVVGRYKPESDGTFSIGFDAPKGLTAAVYRLSTSVRKTRRNPKLFDTYTLPRAIDLLG